MDETYLVITNVDGYECVDECDTVEEACAFARENAGRVVKASEYIPHDPFREWMSREAEDFGVIPGVDFPATLHPYHL